MRTKFNVFLTLMLALVVQISFAQEKVITGVVTETGTGDPIPGANVIIKGTNKGAATDFDGKYTIKANSGDVLVFSVVGYKSVERKVGQSNTINVTLSPGDQLETVVINAIGVEVKKRTEKGISTSKVKAKVLQTTGEQDPVAALSGKVSGVKINIASGDPGASANIVIRGPKTILGSTQPLFVIDGVPMIGGIGGSGVDGVERPSKIADIDPDDIASIKILKGAAAAALWGSDGANGVVLITTKSGKYAKKGSIGVVINSSISFDKPLTKYPLQDKFAKGLNGTWSSSPSGRFSGSWGDKISDRPGGDNVVDTTGEYFIDQDGKKWYPIVDPRSKETFNEKNYNSVIGTGTQLKNGIQLTAATEKSRYYLSLSNLNQDGIFANSYYDRTTVNYKQTIKPTKKLKLSASIQYTNSKQNAIQKGSNLSGLLLGLYRTPADFDNSGYIGTKIKPGDLNVIGSHRSYRRQIGTDDHQSPGYNNPLFTVYEQLNPYKSNHIVSGLKLNYNLTDWFTLIARSGLDFASSKYATLFPVNSGEDADGSYSTSVSTYYRLNNDLIGQVTKDFNDDLSMDLLVGVNLSHYKGDSGGGSYRNFLLTDNTPTPINSTSENKSPSFGTTIIRKYAYYGSATFTFKSMLYATLTGRYEASSTYYSNIFYPSVSLAWDFNKLDIFKDSKILNSGTLRASYAQVGNDPFPYALHTYFNTASDGNGWGDSWSASAYNGSIWRSVIQGNPNIKPEITTEIEGGIDLRMFNRMNLSFTMYNSDSQDLILYVKQPASSGYQYKWDNVAAMTNKGIELELGYDIIQKDDMKWNLGITYSQNKNKVTDLAGSDYIALDGFSSTSSGVAEGYAFGILRSGDWKYDNNGKLALDANYFPQHGDLVFAGDPNPDFLAGIHTDFSFKNFKLRVLFDGSFGGQSWDGTTGALTYFGRTLETAEETTISAADAATIVNYAGDPVNTLPYAQLNTDGSYTVRGTVTEFESGHPVLLDQEWYRDIGGGFGPVGTQFFKDATWVKLREISLGYTLRADILKKAKIKSINFGITGRNLWLWTKDKSWHIDPESNLSGSSKGRGLQYFNHPTTKSFLFSTKINF